MSNDVKKGQNVPWNKMLVDYQNFLLVKQEVKEMFPVLLLCHRKLISLPNFFLFHSFRLMDNTAFHFHYISFYNLA